jgi:hypothetical protein
MDIKEMSLAELDRRCEDAREERIAPLREAEIADCIKTETGDQRGVRPFGEIMAPARERFRVNLSKECFTTFRNVLKPLRNEIIVGCIPGQSLILSFAATVDEVIKQQCTSASDRKQPVDTQDAERPVVVKAVVRCEWQER